MKGAVIDMDHRETDMDYKKIGERIAHLRINKGYSREGFAGQVGVSTRFLYDLEAGKKGFSVWVLYNISQALSVSCDYIITGQINSDYEKLGRLVMEACEELDCSISQKGGEIKKEEVV